MTGLVASARLAVVVAIAVPSPGSAQRCRGVAAAPAPRRGTREPVAQLANLSPHEADDVLDRLHGFGGDARGRAAEPSARTASI